MGSGVSKETSVELSKLHVVIVGGGYAGLQVAVDLRKAGVKFTIIDPKEYFHHCVGALRAAVNPEYAVKTAIPLKDAFGESFIQGSVESLDMEEKKVTLEGGKEVVFTHCVIAVGSLGPVPARTQKLAISDLLEECKEIGEVIAAAENIVIVGGGPVGVEMAGEITDKYKAKGVTIVSSSDKLICPDFNDKFNSSINSLVEGAGVKVIHGRVTNLPQLVANQIIHQTVTVGDQEIEADLVLSCVGLPPNKTMIEKLVSADSIDENHRIKVNEYLEVEGHPSMFAIGDCCNTPEHKMAAFAGKHGELVASNIIKEASGQTTSQYKQAFVGMLVPFGTGAGAGIINGWHIPNFVGAKLKYADLFTSKYWGTLGIKVPQ
eukprot:GFUD01016959.1.p1 GENE.GFUD01016959.1~~GFUD01016959.1.p1  ORF type:complete len:376 (+),score=91.40 GFUD01016959.1:233-1360(+)